MLCVEAHAARHQDLGELHSRINALEKKLGQNEASKNEAADALRESEIAISSTSRKLAELDARERDVDASLSQLMGETAKVGDSIRLQQDLLGKLLYRHYLTGEQEYLKLLLNEQDPNQVARNLQYLTYISRARADMLRNLSGNLHELDTLAISTREKKAELEDIMARQRAQKQELEQEKARKKAVLERVSIQIGKERKEISRLKQDENRLKRLVEKIGKTIRQSSKSLMRNEKLPDASLDNSPFRQLKGHLSLPVQGELTNRFGAPRLDGGLLWKGLFIRAATGQKVRAVAAGQVVFADWLRGFGNMIILDHGGGYMSLYGDNETLLKGVGDRVHGGDTIAEVGNSGGNAESGLYFELREQGVPLDPMKWVTIK